MRCWRFCPVAVIGAAAAVLVPLQVCAQDHVPSAGPAIGAAQPYKLVAVRAPDEYSDASLAAFRKDLAELAQRRIYAGLARAVASDFFWERDFEGAFNPKRSAVENLAAAISLERGDGAGWQWLAAMAAEASASAMPSRLGVICAPARPQFESFEFEWLIELTHSARTDWGYPRAGKVDVRAQARDRSAVIETIGLHFVRLLGVEAKQHGIPAVRSGWMRIATPAGRSGFVAPGKIAPVFPARLCYAKDVLGRWHIAGFVGAGD